MDMLCASADCASKLCKIQSKGRGRGLQTIASALHAVVQNKDDEIEGPQAPDGR